MIKAEMARNLTEYLGTIDKYREQFGLSLKNDDFIFRGMSDSKYPLIPGILRQLEEPKKSEHMDVKITGDVYRYLDNEIEIISHFKKEACAISELNYFDDTFAWIQHAQHYGVPTRLLDFSANSLVALFFCCNGEKNTTGVVWILNQSTYMNWMREDDFVKTDNSRTGMINSVMNYIEADRDDRKDIPHMSRPVFFIPHYIDTRMSQQESRFLLWGINFNPLEKMIGKDNVMNLSPDGHAYKIAKDKRFLGKILIPPEDKHRILQELDYVGISERTIYPGLDGIGKYINRYYTRTPEDGCFV